MMDAVVADVHFPEDILLRHPLEVAVGVFPDGLDEGEHIRMRHADAGASAPLSKGEQIPFDDGIFHIGVFDEAIVEKGDVRIGRQCHLGHIQMGRDLNSPQDADAIGVLFLDQIDMIVISAERNGAGGVGDHVFGGNQSVKSAKIDAVIVVTNAEQLNAACNGRFHDGFGAVLAAE